MVLGGGANMSLAVSPLDDTNSRQSVMCGGGLVVQISSVQSLGA